jgi:hypothetical protein
VRERKLFGFMETEIAGMLVEVEAELTHCASPDYVVLAAFRL